jgi:glycosyltransferase involved in cell wall biosynthesis
MTLSRRRTRSTGAHTRGCDEVLRVGLLQLGDRRGGIHRDGRIIASELRRLPAVRVTEHETLMSARGWRGLRQALAAVRALPDVDITLVPYGRYRLWAASPSRILQLLIVHLGLRRRTVAILHDVYAPGSKRRSEWWALAACTALSRAVIVHGEGELTSLRGLPGAGRATVVPLLVESRSLQSREAARGELGVDPAARVIAMVGWIHPRKNHELALRALSALGPDVQLWLIGGAPEDGQTYLTRLLELARQLGVHERLLVTGYISEDELDTRLAAIDVGLCPYLDASASASLSTLVAARRPVVASDLPATRELSRLAPRAVVIAASDEPGSVADAIARVLAAPPEADAFDPLLADRAASVVAERYLSRLSSLAGRKAL